jgi:hypothetical protein
MPTLVTVVLATWLLLVLVRQLGHVGWRWSRRVAGAIQRHDAFHLIPSFCFFAPNPPLFEYELLYRDMLEDGRESAWRALDLYSRRWHRPVWNPEKRRYQVAFRWCTALIERVQARVNGCEGPGELFVSAAYVSIACRVADAPHAVTAVATQFLIAVSPGFDARKEPAIAFVSPPFRL